MFAWTLAFLFGGLSLNGFSHLPSLIWVGLLLLILCCMACRYACCWLGVAFLLGVFWTAFYAHHLLHWHLPSEWEGKNVIVEGHIASIPEQHSEGSQFLFKVMAMYYDKQVIKDPTLLHLNWRGAHVPLWVGDKWQLTVRLKQPHGLANPGSFNYESWLFQKGIRATGYVAPKSNAVLLLRRWWHAPIDRIRQIAWVQMTDLLKDKSHANLIIALALGIQSGISTAEWEMLRRTGTTHLMAISGLHISLVAGFAFFIIEWLWRRSARLCLKLPSRIAAAYACFLAALFYALLAGLSVPTQRALLMIAVAMFSVIYRRRIAAWDIFAVALLFILICEPLATLSASFWLSFAAVAILLYSMQGRLQPQQISWRFARIHILIFIGMLPLSLFFFQQTSLISPLANIFAVPWTTFIVVPLTLLGTALLPISSGVASLLLTVANAGCSILWQGFHWLSVWRLTQWYGTIPCWGTFAVASLSALLLLSPRGLPGKTLCFHGLLALTLMAPVPLASGQIKMTVLDVGQGLAVVIRTRHHTLLYDTGLRYGDTDTGTAVIIPYLRTLGIKQLDMLMLSHGDLDHIGGADSVLAAFPTQVIKTSFTDNFKQHPASFCKQDQHWQWDGVNFEILHPGVMAPPDKNNRSCVLKITTGENSLLLTGDIEKLAERQLLTAAEKLRTTIVVAPHHGSNSSSQPAFVAAVAPRYVLFSTGYRNRYRFPRDKVVKRYMDLSVTGYNTAVSGAITFLLTPHAAVEAPVEYRKTTLHYWQAAVY